MPILDKKKYFSKQNIKQIIYWLTRSEENKIQKPVRQICSQRSDSVLQNYTQPIPSVISNIVLGDLGIGVTPTSYSKNASNKE